MVGHSIISRAKQAGFTLVEILIVIAIIGTLSAIVITNIGGSREKALETSGRSGLETVGNALKLYLYNNNYYPIDASDSGVPNGISKYIAEQSNLNLPSGPWPGSKYDYDAWNVRTGRGTLGSATSDQLTAKDESTTAQVDTVQISIRFCTYAEYSGPNGATLCKSRMPKNTWATAFTSNDDAFYYCVRGYCRSNQTTNTDRGYCINCADNKGIKYPGE